MGAPRRFLQAAMADPDRPRIPPVPYADIGDRFGVPAHPCAPAPRCARRLPENSHGGRRSCRMATRQESDFAQAVIRWST